MRKAAARGLHSEGTLQPGQLPRFRALLAEDAGKIMAKLSFGRDEEGRDMVATTVSAEIAVTCQRCLRAMPLALHSSNILAVVWSDDQARHLPRRLDPWIVADGEDGDLWGLVEEELILALPAYSYHEQKDCNEVLVDMASRPLEEEGADRPNPFDVLAQLKPGQNSRS